MKLQTFWGLHLELSFFFFLKTLVYLRTKSKLISNPELPHQNHPQPPPHPLLLDKWYGFASGYETSSSLQPSDWNAKSLERANLRKNSSSFFPFFSFFFFFFFIAYAFTTSSKLKRKKARRLWLASERKTAKRCSVMDFVFKNTKRLLKHYIIKQKKKCVQILLCTAKCPPSYSSFWMLGHALIILAISVMAMFANTPERNGSKLTI